MVNKKIQNSTTALKRRKNSLRLPGVDYSTPFAYSLTICTYERQDFFRDDHNAKQVLSILEECVAEFHYSLFAYCLMPDHLHLLVSPQDSGISVSEFIRNFKSRTAFHFKTTSNLRLWQRGFYDHVVRKSEELQSVADYIFHNPVRKGLVETPDAYPYSGPKVGANL